MNIGDRIRNLREKCSLTQEEVGKKIGVTKATVNRYETGEIDIKRTIAIKLADVLNTTPHDIESPAPSNTYPLDDIKFVNVPVIGSVAAGTGCLADNEIIGYEPTDYDDVKDGQEYSYLTVKGDSMYPKF